MMNESAAAPNEFLQPIVFVGPSIPLDLAKRTLPNADFRPPIRRGNLDGIPGGAIVGIIDGVFAETLAISPGEIREAIERGVLVYGASSMGALRAAEIPKVVGVGRIVEMYRTGAIERDDEVALLFDPCMFKPLTVPLVNLRYAVDRLVRSATLSRDAGNALVESSARLHYTQRTYEAIFQNSSLAHNHDIKDIIRLLRNFDLKREDAQFLLETLVPLKPTAMKGATIPAPSANAEEKRVQATEPSDAPVLIWESGDSVEFGALVQFLKMTGSFEQFARNAIGRFAVGGTPIRSRSGATPPDDRSTAQSLLDATRLVWGWESPEEAHVTMRDLGLGLLDVASSLEKEVAARQLTSEILGSRVFAKALRAELWVNELSLKREALRLGALQFFGARGLSAGPPTKPELDDARRAVTRLRTAMQWSVARSDLQDLGVSDRQIEVMVHDLALARRAGRPVVKVLDERHPPRTVTPRASRWRDLGIDLTHSLKADCSHRFSMPISEAAGIIEQIAKQIGLVRIGMIGQLDTLGIHIAQAFGERSGWSSSFSSGKAETREGARIGSVMEEVELHTQDAFQPAPVLRAAFDRASTHPLVDPHELDLPFDSRYHDGLELEWSPTEDILGCHAALVPSASLVGERLANDIFYSPRLGGKVFSSSGLGAGFSLAEAVVHAAAELIERHAVRLAEIEIDNPGSVGVRQFWFVDFASLPETPRRIVEKYRRAGMSVRILDITPEIAVPTFYARVFDDPFEADESTTSDGFACHPDPEVAVTMALLEAAQTKAGVIAGGREDYSLQARSLGRHERPRTMLARSQVFWFCNDRPARSFMETVGFCTRDILEELEWMVDRVEEAGYRQFLVTDFTMSRIQPAHAARVIIPGLESTNPLFTGPRARATLIRDLLPRYPEDET